ncbi:MAG: cytochrome c biogenesis protein CcsA [Polyangiaceae bacterium]
MTTAKPSTMDWLLLAALVAINVVALTKLPTHFSSGMLFVLVLTVLSAGTVSGFRLLQKAWSKSDATFYGLSALCASSVIYTIYFVFMKTPAAQAEAGGLAQKIFYFHVPVAYGIYIAGIVCLVASAMYLVKQTDARNAWAKAGAEGAALFGALVLVSGPLWAKKAWGVYWTWDPRLTTVLLTELIFVAIVLLRAFTGDGRAERVFAAALGVLGTVTLPIIHYSVKQWGGNHPTVVSSGGGGLGHPAMYHALWLGSWAITVLFVPLVVWLRARSALLQSSIDKAWQEGLARGLIDNWGDDPAPALASSVGTKSPSLD